MRRATFSFLGLALALIGSAAFAADAPPPPQGPIDAVMHIEVAPAKTAEAIKLLKDYRDATRKEPGATLADVYEEKGAGLRFVTNDMWTDYAAYQAHAKGAAAMALIDGLKPIEYGPPYIQAHTIYATSGEGKTGGVIVVTHLDVGPADVPHLVPLLQPYADDSAKDKGSLRFEIMRQTPDHQNHFRLWEVWDNEKDWEAHNMSAHAQAFRGAIGPLLGTPYDQRVYTLVK